MEMPPEELVSRLERGDPPLIVDVRSAAEFNDGHIPGAIHVPFWSAFFRAGRIPGRRDAPIVVYCGHGPRAEMAASALRLRGFTDLRLLRGHMSQWRRSGSPLSRT